MLTEDLKFILKTLQDPSHKYDRSQMHQHVRHLANGYYTAKSLGSVFKMKVEDSKKIETLFEKIDKELSSRKGY